MEAHLSGENAFTYGLLYERESEAADELRPGAQGLEESVAPSLPALDELTGTVSAAAAWCA